MESSHEYAANGDRSIKLKINSQKERDLLIKEVEYCHINIPIEGNDEVEITFIRGWGLFFERLFSLCC